MFDNVRFDNLVHIRKVVEDLIDAENEELRDCPPEDELRHTMTITSLTVHQAHVCGHMSKQYYKAEAWAQELMPGNSRAHGRDKGTALTRAFIAKETGVEIDARELLKFAV